MRHVLYILGDLDDDDVEWLLANGERQQVPSGAAIIEEGRPPSALFLVLDGTLAVTTAALRDEVDRLVRGTLAGEMSFVDELPPSATVRAISDALVLAIPRKALSLHLRDDPRFAARFYRALARLLSERLRASHDARARLKPVQLDEPIQELDELDVTSMDTVYLAGQRFDRILRRLIGT